MHASIGDLLRIHSRATGRQDHYGKIIDVRGPDGSPPYLVKFNNGHESLIYPGPDSIIEPRSHTPPPR